MSRAPLVRSSRRGGGPGDLRKGNLTQILRYVRDFGPSSRHDIALGCGLGISSLTDLVSELRARRLVRELDPLPRPGAGRPTRPLALDGDVWCVLGVQLDLLGVSLVATTVGGLELWRARVPCPLHRSGAERGRVLLQGVLCDQLRRIPPGLTLVAVHVALPGYPAADGTTVTQCPVLEWDGLDLGATVAEALARAGWCDVAVQIEHDAHLAAVQAVRAELGVPVPAVAAYLGGWRQLSGGVVLDGQIFHGADGEAGDLGHLPVDPDGPGCECGRRGCLESLLGPRQLLVGSGLLTADEAEAMITNQPFRAPELLAAAAAAWHPGVLRTLQVGGAALDVAIDGIVCTLDPDAVVLGGYLAALRHALPGDRAAGRTRGGTGRPRVVALESSETGRVVLGAALSARDACLADPLALTTVR